MLAEGTGSYGIFFGVETSCPTSAGSSKTQFCPSGLILATAKVLLLGGLASFGGYEETKFPIIWTSTRATWFVVPSFSLKSFTVTSTPLSSPLWLSLCLVHWSLCLQLECPRTWYRDTEGTFWVSKYLSRFLTPSLYGGCLSVFLELQLGTEVTSTGRPLPPAPVAKGGACSPDYPHIETVSQIPPPHDNLRLFLSGISVSMTQGK